MLRAFLENTESAKCHCIKRVISSGEELGIELEQMFFECLDCAELHNLYGPTEAAVDVTWWRCRNVPEKARIPIGKPISNMQIYVVDRTQDAVPIGVTGELLIGGAGIGRGYVNRPEMTAERFIPDPFSRAGGSRVYRTGDLARFQPSGDIEFLGRMDHQVKIRGFRIELGEIEASLDRHPFIGKSIVKTRKDPITGCSLIAYVVPSAAADSGSDLSAATLRSYLSTLLPRYMIPKTYILLKEAPLTATGKIDRRSLPAPDSVALESVRSYQAPETELEKAMADIFQEVLGTTRIGVDDSFFDLGGHSLLAVQALSRVRNKLNVEIPLSRLFEDPTIGGMARAIVNGEAGSAIASPITRVTPLVEGLISKLDRLSDDEVESLLQDAARERGRA
jgi:acyl carrier protein